MHELWGKNVKQRQHVHTVCALEYVMMDSFGGFVRDFVLFLYLCLRRSSERGAAQSLAAGSPADMHET